METHISYTSALQWAMKKELALLQFHNTITIGPTPIPFGSTIKPKVSSRFWAVFFIVLIMIYLIGVICIRLLFVNLQSQLCVWSEIGCTIVTCVIIIIETQCCYEYFVQFLVLKQQIENDLTKLCYREMYEQEKYLSIRNHLRLFVTFFVFAWTIDILNIFRMDNDPTNRFSASCLLIPITYTRIRCFQHHLYTSMLNLYIKLIRLKIESIIIEIDYNESLAKQRNQHHFTMNSQKILFELNLIMRIFTTIFEMTSLINKMFRYSMLIIICQTFIEMLANLFAIYYKIYQLSYYHLAGLSELYGN